MQNDGRCCSDSAQSGIVEIKIMNFTYLKANAIKKPLRFSES
jgi:hypothetical protein